MSTTSSERVTYTLNLPSVTRENWEIFGQLTMYFLRDRHEISF